MGSQDLTVVSLGVYLESPQSLLGADLESVRPPKTELSTFIFALGFGPRFWTIFGTNLTPNGHPKWTKSMKMHWILRPFT